MPARLRFLGLRRGLLVHCFVCRLNACALVTLFGALKELLHSFWIVRLLVVEVLMAVAPQKSKIRKGLEDDLTVEANTLVLNHVSFQIFQIPFSTNVLAVGTRLIYQRSNASDRGSAVVGSI